MRHRSVFAEEELQFLRELVRAKVGFMLVGLSAAALQGAPVVTQDVDLWFRDLEDPRFRKVLRKVGGTYIPSTGDQPPVLAGRGVELFDLVLTMHGLRSFEEEYRNAIKISLGTFKVHVLPLERIIASKRSLNRPKDRLSLPVLSDVQRVLKMRAAKRSHRTAR